MNVYQNLDTLFGQETPSPQRTLGVIRPLGPAASAFLPLQYVFARYLTVPEALEYLTSPFLAGYVACEYLPFLTFALLHSPHYSPTPEIAQQVSGAYKIAIQPLCTECGYSTLYQQNRTLALGLVMRDLHRHNVSIPEDLTATLRALARASLNPDYSTQQALAPLASLHTNSLFDPRALYLSPQTELPSNYAPTLTGISGLLLADHPEDPDWLFDRIQSVDTAEALALACSLDPARFVRFLSTISPKYLPHVLSLPFVQQVHLTPPQALPLLKNTSRRDLQQWAFAHVKRPSATDAPQEPEGRPTQLR